MEARADQMWEKADQMEADQVDAEIKLFVDLLWFHADSNSDETLDNAESKAALGQATEQGYITEKQANDIFGHVAKYAGEDDVVSKEEMFEAIKDAAEWYPWDFNWIYERAKAYIEVKEAPWTEIRKIREEADILHTEARYVLR